MTKFLSTLDEENFLTYEVSDEALELQEGMKLQGTTHSRPVPACLFAQADQSD